MEGALDSVYAIAQMMPRSVRSRPLKLELHRRRNQSSQASQEYVSWSGMADDYKKMALLE